MSGTGIHIDFNAPATLRKWPSLNNERTAQQLLRAASPLRRQPTFLFWLQPMDVMVFSPRSSVRGTRGKGCQEESKANGKTRRRIRFCGVKRFVTLHKSFVKLAPGNPARFASPDFSVAGAGLRKRLAAGRNSL
jgi:hypothetical protein